MLAFGFQNAWNTGLGSCRAPYIAIVNDYAWLADEFIEQVIAFYEVCSLACNSAGLFRESLAIRFA